MVQKSGVSVSASCSGVVSATLAVLQSVCRMHNQTSARLWAVCRFHCQPDALTCTLPCEGTCLNYVS